MSGVASRAVVRPWISLPRFRIWQLGLLTGFVAVAISNIQDQKRSEPALIALASAGFVAYWLIGWGVWRYARRFEARLGTTPLLVAYLVTMAGLFLVATIFYLMIEYVYLSR